MSCCTFYSFVKSTYSLCQNIIFLALVCTSPSSLKGSYNFFDNWGFDQGGGFRQGNFTDEDGELVVTNMALNKESGHLAVAGAIGNKWAVRVYEMGVSGPVKTISWNGDESFEYATATSLHWIPESGKLVCGIEHVSEGVPLAVLTVLTPEFPEVAETLKLPDIDYLIDMFISPDNPDQAVVLGEAKKSGKCFTVDFESMQVVPEFTLEEITQPKALAVKDNQFWIVGHAATNRQEEEKAIVEVYIGNDMIDSKSLGRGIYISSMVASVDRIFLTGLSSSKTEKNEKENFFLKCMELDENLKIQAEWKATSIDIDEGREWGTKLTAMLDGGVVVSGNFRKSWLIGQSDPFTDSALLAPYAETSHDFDSFLARYDENGSLIWAQSSGFMGNDYAVDVVTDANNSLLLLGNRKVDASFGPYLLKIKSDTQTPRNAPLVEFDPSNAKLFKVFSWETPSTIRFAEPIDGTYFSASAVGKPNFVYEINGKIVSLSEMPMFTPGDINVTAKLFRNGIEQNATTHSILALKGRPYLRLSFEQNQTEVQLKAELFGLHSTHLAEDEKLDELGKKINFSIGQKRGVEVLSDGKIRIDPKFTGFIDILANFEGDEHYEPASRTLLLEAKNGVVSVGSKDGRILVQVKDLDGWQKNRVAKIGDEMVVAATQGFGKNRKFNKWVEFSQDSRKLRTARVQSPFKMRTGLIADEDMTLFAHYNFTFTGTAINGYLGGSTVFMDFNLNGKFDEDEPSGFTTRNGGFEIEIAEEDFLTHDKNNNGMLDPPEGMIVVVGGLDHSSNIPLAISYKAPPSYSVITAVSTLVAAFVEEGLELSEAEQVVSQFLDLPAEIHFPTFEPLREVFNDGEKAKEFILKSTQLANLFNEGSRFLQMKSGNKISRILGAELIVDAIKNKILERSKRRSTAVQTIDLNDPGMLLDVITAAEDLAPEDLDDSLSENLQLDSSIRADLATMDPGIAEAGNEAVLSEMVDQIASANQSLDQLTESTELEPTEFKVLASASQNILNDLGEKSSNTLFEDEVVQLLQADNATTDDVQLIIEQSSEIESLPTSNDLPNSGESSGLAEFSIEALEEFSAQSGINVYAPILSSVDIEPPAELGEILLLGSISAYDPEGTAVTYSMVGDDLDLDLDEISMLLIEPNSGQILVQDFDDLQLWEEDNITIIVRVSDASGLFQDEEVVIDISEWTYFAGRLQIPELALSVPENLPVGSIIHQFQRSDVLGGPIDYLLVSGEGDADNALFLMDENGTLKTGVTFDYEAGSEDLEIRVQAIDSRSNLVEKVLEVSVSDEIIPNVETQGATVVEGKLILEASIQTFGAQTDSLTFGFFIDREPITNLAAETVRKVIVTSLEESYFKVEMIPDSLGGHYYFIAFAENLEGIDYGVEQSFVIPRIISNGEWVDGGPLDKFTGWWKSSWFGIYNGQFYPWIYHQNLGWVYINSDNADGTWLYHERLGWVWTRHDTFPYIYLRKRLQWTYINLDRPKTTLYDYQTKEWFEPDTPIQIVGNVSPPNGGQINGFGYYYRWDEVRLEATPGINSTFTGWSGDINGVESIIIFEAIRNLNIKASFSN